MFNIKYFIKYRDTYFAFFNIGVSVIEVNEVNIKF